MTVSIMKLGVSSISIMSLVRTTLFFGIIDTNQKDLKHIDTRQYEIQQNDTEHDTRQSYGEQTVPKEWHSA